MLKEINNEKDLKEIVEVAGEALQKIQDYLSENPESKAMVRFPRGYIKTASHFRSRLPLIVRKDLRDNLAYHLMLSNVYQWIIERTDLGGQAYQMVIKWQIALITSICEALIKDITKKKIGANNSFYKRCNKMVEQSLITENLKDELCWLWEVRSKIHIDQIDGSEYQIYSIIDYKRAKKAGNSLLNELRKLKSTDLY